jgi:hypothetical protein
VFCNIYRDMLKGFNGINMYNLRKLLGMLAIQMSLLVGMSVKLYTNMFTKYFLKIFEHM